MKVTVSEQGALFIALGETMLNKNVSLDEAQKEDQRDYVVSRLQHYGVNTVERATEIAKGGLKGLKIDPEAINDPGAIKDGSNLADSGIPATSQNGTIVNNAPGVPAGTPVEVTEEENKGTSEGAQERVNAAADAKKEDDTATAKKK